MVEFDPKKNSFKVTNNRTALSPIEEETFQLWRRSLPTALQVDDEFYDLRGAWKAGLKPIKIEDGTYHLSSRNPRTGLLLKSPKHPTFHKMLKAEADAGYEIYEDPTTHRLYSRKK